MDYDCVSLLLTIIYTWIKQVAIPQISLVLPIIYLLNISMIILSITQLMQQNNMSNMRYVLQYILTALSFICTYYIYMYCYNLVLLIFNYVFKLKMYVCIHQFIINHSHAYILWESPYLFLYLIPRVNNIKYVTHIVYIAHNMSQGLTHALTTMSYIQVKTGFCTNGGNIYMYDSTKVIMVIPKICTMITCNIHKINIALFNEDLFQLLRWHAWNNAYLHNYIVVIIILIVFLF